ncbi:MAG: GGDEF domain-containing protein [Rubrivivax sp.]|nr:GGDEF domain-containing protein [Rubrivivax sp.]
MPEVPALSAALSVRRRLAERRASQRRKPARNTYREPGSNGCDRRADQDADARRVLELERELMVTLHEMHRDPLTGLLNRRGLARVYAQFSAHQRAAGDAMCCVYLDLDDFKRVNDDVGHAAGDACLQHLARVLETTLRRNDVVARVGGDEFVVLLPHLAGADAVTLLYRVKAALVRTPVPLAGGKLALRFCAGLTNVAPGETLAHVLARADRCLMASKSGPKNRTLFDAGKRQPPASIADLIEG